VFANVEGVVKKRCGDTEHFLHSYPRGFCCIQVETEYFICISKTLCMCSVQFLWVYMIMGGVKDSDAYCTNWVSSPVL